MKWNRDSGMLKLNARDLRTMTECSMSITHILREKRSEANIPPLWSILSYVMLQAPPGEKNIWRRYRTLLEAAANAENKYRLEHIVKSDGTIRELAIPSFDIRIQQRFIMHNILNNLPIDDHAFAYRKGTSIVECARPHIGQDVLIHMDIRNFFGSITEDMVFDMLHTRTGYSGSLCRFLARLCCCRGSLPQGACTSPVISNLVFQKCDELLAQLARIHGMHYSRYSDDLYFSGDSSLPVRDVLQETARILRFRGFQI